MSYSNYFLIAVPLSVMILLILIFIFRKKNIPIELYAEGLKDENSGHFEAAILYYESALNAEKRSRFHSSNLRNKINEKLKVLHTNIEYKNSLHIVR